MDLCFFLWSLMTFVVINACDGLPDRPRRGRTQETAEVMREIKNLKDSQELLQREMTDLRKSMMAVKDMVTYSLPEDCSVAKARGSWSSTAYIRPPGLSPRVVRCDQHDVGGGWTVVLARRNSSHPVNFNATWQQYKEGFGDISSEYWIGNDVLHALTKEAPNQLRAILTDWNNPSKTATYNYFTVGSESDGYRLGISDYQMSSRENEAGDSLSSHNNHKFSTHDRDADADQDHCAQRHGGGWWYYRCYSANPTGYLLLPQHKWGDHGMIWRTMGNKTSLMSITMMIRPRPSTYH